MESFWLQNRNTQKKRNNKSKRCRPCTPSKTGGDRQIFLPDEERDCSCTRCDLLDKISSKVRGNMWPFWAAESKRARWAFSGERRPG